VARPFALISRLARDLDPFETMRKRLLLAVSLAALAVGLLACGLATKGSDSTEPPGCVQGCNASDAATPIGMDGGFAVDAPTEAGTRSPLCGNGCDPDAIDGSVAACGTGNGSQLTEPLPSASLACQVIRSSSDTPIGTCQATGSAAEAAPCQQSSDCAPGMACTTDGTDPSGAVGHCRTYCCDDGTPCATGTYCGVLRMFEPAIAFDKRLPLPVCASATNCTLLQDGECISPQVCTLVNNKTTTCARAGVGVAGSPCDPALAPCSSGFYCVAKTGTCLKLCHVGSDGQDCGTGLCESGGAFPEGFGVCK
jgi:hypothetical protein